MTPEELDEARAKEAYREWCEDGCQGDDTIDVAAIAARLAREGWKPPEPVDPDLLAFREWVNRHGLYDHNVVEADTNAGKYDSRCEAQAFLAGARMGREQGEKARKREALRELTKLTEEYGGYEELNGINEEGGR